MAIVPAVRSSVRQSKCKRRQENEDFRDALSLIEANKLGFLQREVDRTENKGEAVSNTEDTNTGKEVSERVPLFDRLPAQATDEARGKRKSSGEKPAKRPPKGKKANVMNSESTVAQKTTNHKAGKKIAHPEKELNLLTSIEAPIRNRKRKNDETLERPSTSARSGTAKEEGPPARPRITINVLAHRAKAKQAIAEKVHTEDAAGGSTVRPSKAKRVRSTGSSS